MLASIQYLRGFAALGVVLCHLFPVFVIGSFYPFASGAAGVDVFFVISGFIMWHIVQEREPEPLNFLLHRLVRIAPIYWIVTLTLAFCAALKPNLFPLDHPTPLHVLMSMGFIPHGPGTEDRPLVTQGWTLNYEILFYLIFATVLLFPDKFRFFLLAFTLVCLSSVGFFITPTTPLSTLLTNSLLLEFLGGVLVAIAFSNNLTMSRPVAIVTILVALFFIIARPIDVPMRVIFYGIPAFMIVLAMVSLEGKGFSRNSKTLLALGDASYSLYLVHFLAGSFYLIFSPYLGLPTEGLIAFSFAVIAALISGFALNILLEKPLLAALRSAFLPKLTPGVLPGT